MRRNLGLLAGMAIVALLLGGCVVVQPDGQWHLALKPPSLPTSTVLPQPAVAVAAGTPSVRTRGSSEPALPGGELTSGPWKVQVERVYAASVLPDGSKPRQFMLVDLTFQNTEFSAALVVAAKYFSLKTATGVTVKPFPTKLGSFNARSLRPIASRLGQNTTMVYAIPSDSGNYTLTFVPGQGANGPMRWLVP